MEQREINEYACRLEDKERDLRMHELLLKRHPPTLGDWFVQTFQSDPQTWLRSRLAFTRTTAVMSMVGYLIGLGDRHGENITLEAASGDTVHVDLNLLFNAGAALRIPEIVPFRSRH